MKLMSAISDALATQIVIWSALQTFVQDTADTAAAIDARSEMLHFTKNRVHEHSEWVNQLLDVVLFPLKIFCRILQTAHIALKFKILNSFILKS